MYKALFDFLAVWGDGVYNACIVTVFGEGLFGRLV